MCPIPTLLGLFHSGLIRQRAAANALSIEFGYAPITRAQLCICGNALVGKTTLVRTLDRMRRGTFGMIVDFLTAPLRPPMRTKGIEITPMSIAGSDFSVWDYAGMY